MLLSEPYLQIRSNSIYQYNLAPRLPVGSLAWQEKREQQLQSINNLREHATYTGTLTPGAKKRLTKAVEFLITSSKHKTVVHPTEGYNMPFKIAFLTLTIHSPERMITGKEAHKTCLEPFLLWLRRKHKCLMYLWKAELQGRGQVHYHITMDTFVHYEQIQKKWNELQQKAGYLDSYYNENGHYNAPSCQIKSVKHVTKLSGYIIKEITKNLQNNESIGGKIWDCSTNLKTAKYFTTVVDGAYRERIGDLIDKGQINAVYTDHCTIFRVINKPAHSVLSKADLKQYIQLMDAVRLKELEPIKVSRKNHIATTREKNTTGMQLSMSIQCRPADKQKITRIRKDVKPPPKVTGMDDWIARDDWFSSN